MLPEDQVQEPDSPTGADEQLSEPSTDEIQPEEATSQEAAEQAPFHEHPRFRELIEEKNELKRERDLMQQKLVETLDKVTAPKEPQVQPKDPYSHLDQETRAYHEFRDNRTREIVSEAVRLAREEERKVYESQLKQNQQMLGNVIAKDFMKAHPDLKKSSPEMQQITQKAAIYTAGGMGLEDALEDAYNAVMINRVKEKAVEETKRQKQERLKTKAAANVETSGIPATNMPAVETLLTGAITEKDIDAIAKEMGIKW